MNDDFDSIRRVLAADVESFRRHVILIPRPSSGIPRQETPLSWGVPVAEPPLAPRVAPVAAWATFSNIFAPIEQIVAATTFPGSNFEDLLSFQGAASAKRRTSDPASGFRTFLSGLRLHPVLCQRLGLSTARDPSPGWTLVGLSVELDADVEPRTGLLVARLSKWKMAKPDPGSPRG